ncbi:MAG: hypothetical protein IPL10_13450 [Bacteroidetes bacterium]|jgi:hypothetical protein|nr:hypothetical protein [Bacteroidota bacterium]MBK8368384.1 hypothetical protein [Bacteroidota bacterium]
MKKLVLTLAVLTVCYTANAQEPEKKKESSSTPPPSRGQERAINESGVSVKTETKKNSASKSTQVTPPGAEDKKKEAKHDEAKKPD